MDFVLCVDRGDVVLGVNPLIEDNRQVAGKRSFHGRENLFHDPLEEL